MSLRILRPPSGEPPATPSGPGVRVAQRLAVTQRVAVVAALAAVLSFYTWTAFTTDRNFPTQMDVEGRDYFNLLADSFRQGQASLLVKPKPELLALEDPYDSTKNYLAYRVHDLSLYQGRYYLYWGPTPVLTLFLPARLLLPGDLPERAAIVVYAFGGLVFSLLLLRWLVRRYLDGSPSWMLWFGGMALATGNVMPFILRRPTVYEVAITAGFCFSMASIYLLLRGALADEPNFWRLAGGSGCLGLAIGARLSTGVLGLLCVAVLVHLVRPRWSGRRLDAVRLTAAVMGPVGVCGVLLLAYNQVRFGSFTEFGLRYQLNDLQLDPDGLGHLSRSPYYYLFAAPRLDLAFPFVHLPPPPFPQPELPGYLLEPTGGLLTASPIALLALACPVVLRRSPRRAFELGLVLFGLAALGGLTLVTLVVLVNGVAMRYSADFTTLFLVAGVMTWIWLTCTMARVVTRRAMAGAGALLILSGAVVGLATSFTGNTDGLREGDPERYESFVGATEALPTAVTMVLGRPAIAEVWSPGTDSEGEAYRGVTRSKRSFSLGPTPVIIRVVSPNDRSAMLRAVVPPGSPSAAGDVLLATRWQSISRPLPVPPEGGVVDLPIRLTRGSNRLELYVQSRDATDGAPRVRITDLRVASPAPG